MLGQRFKDACPTALLVLLSGYVVIHHALFSLFDARVFVSHDEYYLRSFGCAYELFSGGPSWTGGFHALVRLAEQSPYLLYNGLLFATSLLGLQNLFMLRMTNLPFLLSVLLGVFALGYRIRGKKTGLAGAFCVATLAALDNYSRMHIFHLHSASFLVWAYYLAVTIERDDVWSLCRTCGLGLLMGLAIITHPAAILQSVPIWVFLACRAWHLRKKQPWSAKQFVVLAAAPITAVLVSWPLVISYHLYSQKRTDDIFSLFQGGMTAKALVLRVGAWAYDTFVIMPGWIYLPLLIAAVVVWAAGRFVLRVPAGPSRLLPASLIYLLVASLWFFLNGTSPRDFILLLVLAPPYLAGQLAPVLEHGWKRPWMRVALVACGLLFATAALLDKQASLQTAPPLRGFEIHNDVRAINLGTDSLQSLADTLIAHSGPGDIELDIQMARFDPDQNLRTMLLSNEMQNIVFGHLRVLGALVGRRILRPDADRILDNRFRLMMFKIELSRRDIQLPETIRRICHALPDDASPPPILWQYTGDHYICPFLLGSMLFRLEKIDAADQGHDLF